LILPRGPATSPDEFAERRIASGCFARSAARSASLTRSILLRSKRDGTTSAPISRSTARLTSSCDSYVGSDASTTNSSSDASSCFGERGPERRDEIVRQLLDEPD